MLAKSTLPPKVLLLQSSEIFDCRQTPPIMPHLENLSNARLGLDCIRPGVTRGGIKGSGLWVGILRYQGLKQLKQFKQGTLKKNESFDAPEHPRFVNRI